MATADNVELIERLHRRLGESDDLTGLAEFFHPDFVSHSIPPGLPPGVEGIRGWFEGFRRALPDLELRIDELVVDGERVAVATTMSGTHRGELLGLKPTGRRVAVAGIDIIRFADDTIIEHRGLTDTVGLLRQLGSD